MPDDRDDVKATALLGASVCFLEELEGGEGEPSLFLGGNRLGGLPEAARLDLNEDDRVAVTRNQVDLADKRIR